MEKRTFGVSESSFGGLGATYDDHLRLIGKCVENFLLVLTELFRCVMAEAQRANIGSTSKLAILLQWGLVDPKFQVEGIAPTNNSSSLKTRLNYRTCGTKIWTELSFFVTIHAFDRRTDSFLLTRPPCIQCSVVKMCTE